MPPDPTPIFLLTDFGLADPYVGVVRAVIAGIAPHAPQHDLGHALPPQDVRAAAYALQSAAPFLPSGSVVCAVVDPGVGGERRGLALRLSLAGRQLFLVAPDNGLIGPLLAEADAVAAVALDDPGYHLSPVSATFHGRDVFAPVAAHLANGVRLERLGSALDPHELVRLTWPQPQSDGDGWRGEVVHVDRFGNLITNVPRRLLGHGAWRVALGDGAEAPLAATFSSVAVGAPVAYVGSGGLVEVAIRNGSAAAAFTLGVGDPVRLVR